MKNLIVITMVVLLTSFCYAGGVRVGDSTLIGTLDYSDTYTLTENGGLTGRNFVNGGAWANPAVENNYGNTARTFTKNAGTNVFVMGYDSGPIYPAQYPGNSGAGSDTGVASLQETQWGIQYGLRDDYVVQSDFTITDHPSNYCQAIIYTSRLGYWEMYSPGSALGSLAVSFYTSIYNEKLVGVSWTGLDGSGGGWAWNLLQLPADQVGFKWMNMAVRFDKPGDKIVLYSNQVEVGAITLDTIRAAVGDPSVAIYNNRVGISGWQTFQADNFQVGSYVPEPMTLILLGAGAIGLLRKRS